MFVFQGVPVVGAGVKAVHSCVTDPVCFVCNMVFWTPGLQIHCSLSAAQMH